MADPDRIVQLAQSPYKLHIHGNLGLLFHQDDPVAVDAIGVLDGQWSQDVLNLKIKRHERRGER